MIWSTILAHDLCLLAEYQRAAELPSHLSVGFWPTYPMVDYINTSVAVYWASWVGEVLIFTEYYIDILEYVQATRSLCVFKDSPMSYLCGSIIQPDPETTLWNTWTITLLPGYNMDLSYEKFNMLFSDDCEINSLHIQKHDEIGEKYCGHLPDWRESCPCNEVTLSLFITFVATKSIFKISYMISKKKGISTHMFAGSNEARFDSYIQGIFGYDSVYFHMTLQISAQTRLDLVSLRSHGGDDIQCEYHSKTM